MIKVSENTYSFSFRCLSAIDYSPKIKKNKVASRPRNSLLYIKNGKYRYTFGKNILDVNTNELIYLPKGSSYTYEVVSENAHCLQFEFEVTDINSGKSHILTDNPYVLDCHGENENYNTEALMKDVIKYHNRKNEGYDIMVTALMCRLYYQILTQLKLEKKTITESRIEPAVEYIKRHFCDKIYVSHLATLCYMSEPQLRRLFKKSFNMSPIEYKNTMQMNTACELLRTGKTPSEIADILGLDSVCSFSHMFKKIHGISPAQYIKNVHSHTYS